MPVILRTTSANQLDVSTRSQNVSRYQHPTHSPLQLDAKLLDLLAEVIHLLLEPLPQASLGRGRC
jgi:hypothetical protein